MIVALNVQKKTWTIYFVYVILVSANTMSSKRVMPTPSGVNYLLQLLMTNEILPISDNKNLKVEVHPICPFLLHFFP